MSAFMDPFFSFFLVHSRQMDSLEFQLNLPPSTRSIQEGAVGYWNPNFQT